MAEEHLPQMRRVIGVPQKRDEIVAVLTECYARDLFDLEEYEHRVDLVHAATTLDELEALVSEVLRAAKTAAPPSASAGEASTITVTHGVQKFSDRRLAVGRLALNGQGSVFKLDYRSLGELPAEMSIDLSVSGSVVKIIVPAEVDVSDETENTASVVKCRRGLRFRRTPVKTHLRLTGRIRGSMVKIVTRRSRFR
jgi:hypothetical protein